MSRWWNISKTVTVIDEQEEGGGVAGRGPFTSEPFNGQAGLILSVPRIH